MKVNTILPIKSSWKHQTIEVQWLPKQASKHTDNFPNKHTENSKDQANK